MQQITIIDIIKDIINARRLIIQKKGEIKQLELVIEGHYSNLQQFFANESDNQVSQLKRENEELKKSRKEKDSGNKQKSERN